MPFNHFAEKTKYKNVLSAIVDKRIWFSHIVPHFKKERICKINFSRLGGKKVESIKAQ